MKAARKAIRIGICDYAPGYPKTNNFSCNLLRKSFDLVVTDQPELPPAFLLH
jgi:hypothetical protein